LVSLVQQELASSVGYECVWLQAADAGRERLELIGAAGPASEWLVSNARVLEVRGHALLEQLVRSEGVIVVEDVLADRRIPSPRSQGLGIRSLVYVPLELVDGSFVALATATSNDEVRPPTADELGYITGLATHVAAALSVLRYRAALEDAQREREQRRSDLLDGDLENLGHVAAALAHDVRNLLTALTANVAMARLKLAADAPSRRYIEEATTVANQAAELTRQMLARGGRTKAAIDVCTLVRETVGFLEAAVPPNVRLKLSVAEALYVEGDPSQLRRVILNLMTNGWEAIGSAAGDLELRVGLEPLLNGEGLVGNPIVSGPHVAIEVRDTGHGMDQATLAQLFRATFTSKPNGHGLGMASVLAIVRDHGGAIRVQSEAGSGASFVVLLPVHRPDFESLRPTRPEMSVLVVDPLEAVRALAGRGVRGSGLSVVTAASAAEAFARIENEQRLIAAVVLDAEVSDSGGSVLYYAIRESQPGARVILTGDSEADWPAEIRNAPGVTWLPKPYRSEQLAGLLRPVLDD
jgi:signal transduction histidine kinase/CheY-like chemotaxis protein